jgi:hypothetical protein
MLVFESGFGLEQNAPLRLTFACYHVLLRRRFNWTHGIVIGAIRVLLSVGGYLVGLCRETVIAQLRFDQFNAVLRLRASRPGAQGLNGCGDFTRTSGEKEINL